ncbi:MAG TPA: RsmE family RNA methyltransferase [Spirochaetia bacterium]|nr:RsmE family RNA methyltransferase [Spirochaetia bacterium]
MKRFLLPADFAGGPVVELSGRSFHYLCRVRRMKVGDGCDASDHAGNQYRLTMESVAADRCTAHLQAQPRSSDLSVAPESAESSFRAGAADLPEITLCQCLPKGSKLDLIIRQATEAGVSRIVPLLSEYAVPQIDSESAANRKLDRWRRIAREAFQQSGVSKLPQIDPPLPFAELERIRPRSPETIGLFFHQLPVGAGPLEQRSLHEYLSADPQHIALVIGPEGGLSNNEIEQLLQSGFVPVFLGPHVLRTETAALYAIAAVQIVLLEKKTWRIEKN